MIKTELVLNVAYGRIVDASHRQFSIEPTTHNVQVHSMPWLAAKYSVIAVIGRCASASTCGPD